MQLGYRKAHIRQNGPRVACDHAARVRPDAPPEAVSSTVSYLAEATLPSAPFTRTFSVVPSALATFTVYFT